MAKYLNKFYDFIDKIGKPNFILIVFILIALITTSLYQTFSLYSEFEGAHLTDNGIYEYKFILNDSNETNTIIIAPGQNKLIDITITNEGEAPLKYGLYYTSNKSSSVDTLIGYRRDTKILPKGVIKGNTSSIITLKVNNYSSNNLIITFGVKYGFENGEELTLSGEEKWFNEFPLMLSEVEPGSYVDYTGNNGCIGESCNGQNANYVDDTNMGYCSVSTDTFSVNGWRVAYAKDSGAVIVSAGAPECMCTNSDGTTSSTTCSSSLTVENINTHIDNMNNLALKYCNKNLSKDNKCNLNTAWAMNETDFYKITDSNTLISCYETTESINCGYGNDLIDNSGVYWFATLGTGTPTDFIFHWHEIERHVSDDTTNVNYGVRPVLHLDASIVVVGGQGTYDDPYQIENADKKLLSDIANPGDYVEYTGNNGCTDIQCDGYNANYETESNMGYCYSSDYKFNVNGWRVGYISGDNTHIVTAGAPECVSTTDETPGLPTHLSTLNSTALKYCNSGLVEGGVCDNSTTWSINATDFKKIAGKPLNDNSCYNDEEDDIKCGVGNSLIDNNGYYWFSAVYGGTEGTAGFNWDPTFPWVNDSGTDYSFGVRPVVKLDDAVIVLNGSGTYEDPYIIDKEERPPLLSEVAEPGDYVAYTGNNGCTGESCNGQNANYVDDDNKGYCYDSNYQFLYEGWRVGYIEDESAHLISAGATDCLSTDENGVASSVTSSTYDPDGEAHFDNANTIALKYCNSNFAYGSNCNINSSWAFSADDYYDNFASISPCDESSTTECGLGNELIDNGGYYWFIAAEYMGYNWDPEYLYLKYLHLSWDAMGVRPVLKLAPTVYITGGSGTEDDPYTIAN